MSAASSFTHEPVMVDEIVEVFAAVPAGVVVDATVGGGGHSAALLDAHPDLDIVGLDRDEQALAAAASRLARFGARVQLVHRRFDGLADVLAERRLDAISGALFDLGVSSPQLDQADRGFSYRHDGPLDMRMDRTQPLSAATVVNDYDVAALEQLIARYGDERFARRIARAIVAARPLHTTTELAAVVTEAIPAATRRHGGHPAKRTFQAIRIEVNGELAVLPDALDQALAATVPTGRVAVLTYHSGEDRIVKQRMRRATEPCTCPPGLPCVCGAVAEARRVRVPKRPSTHQSERNPRARSAHLRVVERAATDNRTTP